MSESMSFFIVINRHCEDAALRVVVLDSVYVVMAP